MSQRLFVAVVPPVGVRERLDTFLAPRREAVPSLRWTVPEGWHLTCAFMASVADYQVPDLVDALTEVGRRTAPFQVTMSGAGAFPDPDHARAFCLGVVDGAEELGRLATRSRQAVNRCGVVVEGGRFRPHLTLARANGISGTGWLEVFDTIEPQLWPVTDFALLRSLSLPGGAGYELVAEFPLAG